jgi:hypothetical protein
MPGVRRRPGGPGGHARQRRHAERLVQVCEQPSPRSQIVEELVEHRVKGVRLGNPPVSLPHVQNPVNDLAEHLVEGSGRIAARGLAHAGTDGRRRLPHAQGRATGLRHLTRGTSLPWTSGSSCPPSVRIESAQRTNQVVMPRAYRGRPCPGGGRDSHGPANPGVAAGDDHLHHKTRPGRGWWQGDRFAPSWRLARVSRPGRGRGASSGRWPGCARSSGRPP